MDMNLCSEVSVCGNKRQCRKENEDQMLNTLSTLQIWDKSNAEVKNIESIKLQKSNVIASE